VDDLLGSWAGSASGYIDIWVIDAWFAAVATGREARLQSLIEASAVDLPWLDAATSLLRRDFGTAAATLDEIGAAAAAAHVRLWGAEWLVDHGRQADANVQLERSLSFWRTVGARRYVTRSESLIAAAS
jgi:hypothetical protein